MKYKKKLIPLLFATAIQFILSMEEPWHNPIINQDILGEYITRNPGYINHDTICALALVNKQWNSIIKKTSAARRKYFALYVEQYYKVRQRNPIIYNQTKWHTYCSAYAYWYQKNNVLSFYEIKLAGNGNISNNVVEKAIFNIHNIDSCHIYFNDKGNVCYEIEYKTER